MCEEDRQWWDVEEDSTFALLARVVRVDGTEARPDDIDRITISTTDISDPEDVAEVGEALVIEPASSSSDDLSSVENEYSLTIHGLFSSYLRVDARWTKKRDSIGFNFEYRGTVPDADHVYCVTVFIEYSDGETKKLKFWLRSR